MGFFLPSFSFYLRDDCRRGISSGLCDRAPHYGAVLALSCLIFVWLATRNSITNLPWVRRSVLVKKPFGTIGPSFQLKIDVGIDHLVVCLSVADHEEYSIVVSAI